MIGHEVRVRRVIDTTNKRTGHVYGHIVVWHNRIQESIWDAHEKGKLTYPEKLKALE